MRFPGSETITEATCVFDAPDIVRGLARLGYYTVCVGGVGFFNKLSPLGSVLTTRGAPRLGIAARQVAVNIINQLHLTLSLDDETYADKLLKYQGKLFRLTQELQERKRSLLLVFEGPDAAGKSVSLHTVLGGIS